VFLCNYRAPSTERLKARANRRWVTRFPGDGVEGGPAGGLVLQLGKRRSGAAGRRKPAAKTPAAKTPAAKKSATKRPAAKKPATKKSAARRTRKPA